LVGKGKTVLLVAYTSIAVDNVLLRYKSISSNFIRLGSEAQIRPELKEFTASFQTKSVTNVDDLRTILAKPSVVATTLLSVNHQIFQNRKFDYAILDEVSQALPISCIGALALADKYILFGDTAQLP